MYFISNFSSIGYLSQWTISAWSVWSCRSFSVHGPSSSVCYSTTVLSGGDTMRNPQVRGLKTHSLNLSHCSANLSPPLSNNQQQLKHHTPTTHTRTHMPSQQWSIMHEQKQGFHDNLIPQSLLPTHKHTERERGNKRTQLRFIHTYPSSLSLQLVICNHI